MGSTNIGAPPCPLKPFLRILKNPLSFDWENLLVSESFENPSAKMFENLRSGILIFLIFLWILFGWF